MYAVTNETAAEARKAEQRTSFVAEKGKYVGRLSLAEDMVAATGTKGIRLVFTSTDGVKATPTLYTEKTDGTKLSDYGLVIAIMTCLSVRNMEVKNIKSEVWDRDEGAMVERMFKQYGELLNKDLGLLFYMEEFEKKQDGKATGEYGWVAKIGGVFRASDELTAAEILDKKTEPKKLPLMLLALRDRPIQKGHSNRSPGARGGSAGGRNDVPDGYDQMPDDDIPF